MLGKDLELKYAGKQAQLDIALKYYEKALEFFTHINHLQGKLLSAKHMLSCLSDD